MSEDLSASCVIFTEQAATNGKKIGFATLNAEKSLNALTLDMIRRLGARLRQRGEDVSIACVVLQGAGEKAFCAGGDVRKLREAIVAHPKGSPTPFAADYFAEEYRLDYRIHTYDKPILLWGSGIVMGGGLGLMAGASHRIVTETSRIAMPEITIGLYPDVGGSWFLPRMPGRVGLFLALTGAPLNAHDARLVNLADWFVKSDDKLAIFAGLVTVPWAENPADNHGKLAKLLRGFAAQAESHLPASMVRAHFDTIQRVTDGDTLEEVSALIADHASDDVWMQRAAKALVVGSPTSAALSWELNRCARHLGLADVFRLEWTLSVQCCAHPDFPEGVRALLVDKDGLPHWSPATLADVTSAWLDAHFAQPTVTHPLADLGE